MARLRVVSSDLPDLAGRELELGAGPVVLGRSPDCGLVLKDERVSRRHARLEPASGGGWQVVDLGSANGVLVEGRRVEQAALSGGARFEVGGTTFELLLPTPAAPPPAAGPVAAPPAAPEARAAAPPGPASRAAAPEPPSFILRVVASRVSRLVGQEFVVEGQATVGRSDDCEVALADPNISRRHARVGPAGPGGCRLADAGSSNGIWLDGRRLEGEPELPFGQRFRIGDTHLECHPAPVAGRNTAATGVIADLDELMAGLLAQDLARAGEAVTLGGSQVLLLDQPEWAYFVAEGHVEVFTATLRDGRPLGARQHFITVSAGQLFFGLPGGVVGDAGFLATGKAGTHVRRLPRADLARRAADARARPHLVALVEQWLLALEARLTREVFPRPDCQVRLAPGTPARLAPGQRACGEPGLAWLPPGGGSLLYVDMQPLDERPAAFPLGPRGWVERPGTESAELELLPLGTAELLLAGGLWPALDGFHATLSECELLNKRLALVDEYQRLESKRRQSEEAREAAVDAIEGVLAGRGEGLEPSHGAGGSGPLLEALRAVGGALGLPISPPAAGGAERSFEDLLLATAAASRCRVRRVMLAGDWWRRDNGPLLALRREGGVVALLPRGARRYELFEPESGGRRRVTPAVAGELQPGAWMLYRPLPAGHPGVRGLVAFGAHGLFPDVLTLLLMGLATAVLGACGPYLIGQAVDNAIPQGERGLLAQVGLGLAVVALAGTAFRLTQAIAAVRLESRLDATLQAALWDRLIDLPSGFFRRYEAGDLAERAFGIDGIRALLSRAGLSGLLGALSSLAYAVVMLLYDVRLAGVALLAALAFAGLGFLGNWLQLRHQRQQVEAHGALSALQLQLIAGVAKIRVCAAENHAFRVWAQRLARVRRLDFSAGRVQVAIDAVSAAFPLLASMAVFAVAASLPGGHVSTGAFFAFLAAFGAFVGGVQSLAGASLDLLRAVPIYERLRPILETPPESDPSQAAPGRLRGEISVARVSFRYHEDGPWVLRDVSLTIAPGEFVALVGPSGCGKSSLMRLLLGLERPGQGSVCYDGQDLAGLDVRAVRRQLGVVLQESRVLPTDIFRNIVGNGSGTLEEAWEAAEMAGLADDIRQMPMGMHTVVSEGGGTFSGGQRQRLLIARALVNKPRILFFDEATSALDNRTQAVVTQSMDRLDATRVVIAHRLSTIVNADRIFYLDGGQVQEQGTYAELMARGGLFAQLARRQVA